MALPHSFTFICLHLASLPSSIGSACWWNVFIWMPFCPFESIFVPKAAIPPDFSIFSLEVIIFPFLQINFLWPFLTPSTYFYFHIPTCGVLSSPETGPMQGPQHLAPVSSILLLKAPCPFLYPCKEIS